ncbi:sensor histidine kinase [Corynebacterium ureicelerivorans]
MFLFAAAARITPLTATVSAAVLTQFAASYPEFSSPFIILALLALTAVLASRLPIWQAGLLGLILWYLAQTELGDGVWALDDPVTALLFGVQMLLAGTAGWALRRSAQRRHAESERLQHRIEEERERAVLALHGSVAASLTSVVLRSEALAMSGDEKVAQAAQLIAADARRSMQEVRDLIRFMRGDDSPQTQDPTPKVSVLDAFTALADDLRGHGFTVVESGLSSEVLKNAQLEPVSQVCRELATNILKYGDPACPVIVAALRGESGVTVAVQNSIAARQRDTHMTTGIGLRETRGLVASHGGTLTWNTEGGTWRYELTLP